MSRTQLLAHRSGDHVAVAVEDLEPGITSLGYLDQSPGAEIEVTGQVPLGHKVALEDLPTDVEVIEYGTAIGRTTREIHKGEHVHVHNLKGQRWA
ncbi:MAG: UxaA family hydrolase [Nocardioidaceae bacterium]